MSLSELGFERPTFDELLEAQEDRARELFGENIDTSEVSVLGKFIRLNVADIDEMYQTLEGVYYARFPNTAKGVSLDRLCPFAGISRNPAVAAQHTVLITGVKDATIEAGFEISDELQTVTFVTVDDYVLSGEGEDAEHGTVVATVECDEDGEVGNIDSTDINTILEPVAEVESVQGITRVVTGKEIESDASLRKRFSQAVSGSGSGTAEAVTGAILRVEGVYGCSITENTSYSPWHGMAPHSFTCYVLYDGTEETEQLIAEAIYSKKPIGVATSGDIEVDVVDDGGSTHEIRFSSTTENPLYFNIVLTVDEDFDEEESLDAIVDAIVDYVNGLTNGEWVYASQLLKVIDAVGIVNVATLQYAEELGEGETEYSWQNLDNTGIYVSAASVARTSADKITITTA